MKKYNIEQQLAETLGQQSITPSADAWDRIAHNRMQEKNNRKKPFGYYVAAVAACIILGGGLFFMMNEDSTLPVAAPAVTHTDKKGETMPDVRDAHVASPVKVVAAKEKVVMISKTGQIAKADIPQEKTAGLVLPKAGVQLDNKDLTPVVAVVTQPVPLSKESEAEQLLANAYKKIGTQKQLAQPTNDTALLKEVEAEMNDYYRDKAMRFFALKHKTIRFAVRDKE